MLTIKQCVVGYVLLLLHHRPSLSVFLQAALTTTKTSATHSGFLRYYELVIIFLPSPLLSYTLSSSLSESNIRLSVPRNKYDEVVPREIPNNLLNYSLLLFLLRGTSNVSWKRCNSLFSGYYLLFIHLMCSSLMSVFWVWMDGTARWLRQRFTSIFEANKLHSRIWCERYYLDSTIFHSKTKDKRWKFSIFAKWSFNLKVFERDLFVCAQYLLCREWQSEMPIC